MSAGIQIFGDNGNVQIDQNYVNMVLVARNYVSVPGNTTDVGYGQGAVQVTVAAGAPIMCLDTFNNWMAVSGLVNNGNGTWTFTINSGMGSTVNVAYYIYDLQPNIAPASVGLTVYNGSGRVVFSSDYEPMRLIAFGQSNNATPTFTTQTVSTGGSSTVKVQVWSYPAQAVMLGQSGKYMACMMSCPKSFWYTLKQNDNIPLIQAFAVVNGNNPPYMVVDGGTNGDAGQTIQPFYAPFNSYDSGGFGAPQNIGGGLFGVDVSRYYLPPA